VSVDSHARSVVKAVSYRIVGFIATTVIVGLFTGQWKLATGIGLADTVVKFFLYYGHERTWERIPLGRKPPRDPDYEI
jgi:uncharacterized membrane protein